MRIKLNKIGVTLLPIILFTAIAIIASFLLWASNKGLDLSDESFYISSILYADSTSNNTTFFYLIYQKLFSFLGNSIQVFRLVRLVLSLFSCFILSIGVFQFLKTKINFQVNKVEIFSFTSIGMFLSYSLLPQTISYNSLSLILFNFIIGILLLEKTSSSKVNLLQQSIIGLLLGVLLIAKFPSAILLFGLLIISDIFLSNKIDWKKLFVSIPIWLVFAGLSLLLFLENPLNTFSTISEILSVPIESHSMGNIFKAYYDNIYELIFRHRFLYPFIALILLLSHIIKNKKFIKYSTIIYNVGFVAYFALYCYKTGVLIKSNYNTYQLFDVYFILFVFLVFYYFIAKNRTSKITLNKLEVKLTAFLIIATSVAIFGTNNGITAQVLLYMSLLFIPVYVFIKKLPNKIQILLSLILVTCIGLQVISASVYSPYRNCYSLTKQTNHVKTNAIISTVTLDEEKINLVNQLQEIENIKSEFLFTYSDYFGLTLFTSKKPYDLTWFSYTNHELNCFKISKNTTSEENIIFAFTDNYPPTKELIKCFNQNGISFPNNYRLKKSITFNDCSNNGVTTKLNFYVHKSFVK